MRKPTKRHKLKSCVEYSQVIKVRENQKIIAIDTRNIFGEMLEEKIWITALFR